MAKQKSYNLLLVAMGCLLASIGFESILMLAFSEGVAFVILFFLFKN